MAGSVVSNILLVLGPPCSSGRTARLDLRSLLGQLALVIFAVLLFPIPSVAGWHGDPNRHSLALLSIGPAVVLLGVYLVVTIAELRTARPLTRSRMPQVGACVCRSSLSGSTTVVTALVSEILVHSLEAFAEAAHLSEFFISIVIVAIVGNAAEHGGAVVIARRGKMKLATEIAISSSAQVALLVIPVVTLASFAFKNPLALAFRPIELIAMGGAAAFVAFVIRDGRSRRWEGALLIAVYGGFVVAFYFAGDR